MKTEPEYLNRSLSFLKPPVQNWPHPLFTKRNIQVDVLRLDLMHPQIGGNKWMKLRGFLQKAIVENKRGTLTKGGPWSNHVHACANACFLLGIPFYVWVKGHDALTNQMLEDIRSWNANVRFVNRSLFYDEEAAELFARENNLQYIPMGGADETGIHEVTSFLKSLQLPAYEYAACAVGTATTFAGLAFVENNFTTIIGIEAGTKDKQVQKKIASWQEQLPIKNLQLTDEYNFGSFAHYSPDLIAFANKLYSDYTIATDIVYTSKLFYAVQQLMEKSFFPPNASVLVLHSGGLQGNRSLPTGLLNF